jgi:hypothetical protein
MNDHDLIMTMRESFADVQSATPVEQIVSRSQVIRVRRRIPGAVAVVAAAAAAGTAVVLIPSGSAKQAPVATQRTAYVVSHVARALDAMPANTVVVMQRTTVPASETFDSWDNSTGVGPDRQEIFTRAGLPISDTGMSFSGRATQLTRTTVSVDYQNKTWWRAVSYYGNGSSGLPTVWTCSNAENEDIIWNPQEMAAQLRTELSCGELNVVGSGTADGVPAVELSRDSGGGAVTYWVNATTFLLFRYTATRSGYPAQQVNLQWLPPTAANLAELNVPIPAGFTQVQPGNAPSS